MDLERIAHIAHSYLIPLRWDEEYAPLRIYIAAVVADRLNLS
jgi:hypothetical protein